MASDMHIHTAFSDGNFMPEEILRQARDAGLDYIAITDHDTIDGIRYMYERGFYPSKGIGIIPGIEFSSNRLGHEVHILGYNINIFNQQLIDALNEVAEARWVRFSTMLEKIKEQGFSVTEAEVLKVAGTSHSVGRSHIARVMVKKGFFPDIRTVFSELLSPGKPAYVANFRLSPEEIVNIILQAGGIPVLAHPKLVGDDSLVESLLELDFGGLEVFYPQHDENDTERYTKFARDRGLLLTGGSDFHGIPGRYPENLGEFIIDDDYAKFIYKIGGFD